MHRGCICRNIDVKKCDKICDEDLNCKGYSTILRKDCNMITTSNCTSESLNCEDIQTNGFPAIGNPLKNGTCGNNHIYDGCFIKSKKYLLCT